MNIKEECINRFGADIKYSREYDKLDECWFHTIILQDFSIYISEYVENLATVFTSEEKMGIFSNIYMVSLLNSIEEYIKNQIIWKQVKNK